MGSGAFYGLESPLVTGLICPTLGRVKPGLLRKALVTCNSEPVIVFKKMAMDGVTSCTADTGSSGMSWLLCQSQLSSSGTGTTGLLLGFQGSCPVNDCSHSKSVWGQRALFSHHYDRIPGRNTPSREDLLWLMTSKGSPSWQESMTKCQVGVYG